MKKVILLVLAGVALFAFIFGTSMLWYKFFYNSTGTSNTTGNINVQLSNSNNVIDESGLIPLDDETAKSLTPYEFTVVNDGETLLFIMSCWRMVLLVMMFLIVVKNCFLGINCVINYL